jgi:hypothetical protein
MNRPLSRLAAALIACALLLSACASAAAPEGYPASADVYDSEAARPAQPMEAPMMEGGNSPYASGSGAPAATVERLVIKNATMSLVVADPPASLDRLTALAEELGGYVVSARLSESQLSDGTSVPRAEITLRVPAENLNDALTRIRAESDRLPLDENLSSQDVTAEYTDLQSRLRNLEAAEAQLTRIMEDANRTEDVLNVYNQLVQTRGEIEVIKGQMQYYQTSAKLSSVSVSLIANASIQPLTIAGWEPVGVAREAIQSLINGMQSLVNIVIWLALFVLPLLLVFYLIIILPLTLLWRRLRRSRRQTPPPAAPTPPSG